MRRVSWIVSCVLHAGALGAGAALAYGVAYDGPGEPPVLTILASEASPHVPPRERPDQTPDEPVVAEPIESEPALETEPPPEPEAAAADVRGAEPVPADDPFEPSTEPPRQWWELVDPGSRVPPSPERGAQDAGGEDPPPVETPPEERLPEVEAGPPEAPDAPDVPAAAVADNPSPNYPRRALRLGQKGTVVVAVELDARGVVLAVDLAQACPYPELNREALRAVGEWRFEPARRRGVAVASSTEVEIEFRPR